MPENNKINALIFGLCLFLGLTTLGYLLSDALLTFKEYERTVSAKGLSERENKADIVIWPIQFAQASNNLTTLYNSIESNISEIRNFLELNGVEPNEISLSLPAITDKSAQQYGNYPSAEFRYTALQTITVYSKNVDNIRNLMTDLAKLGKKGIVFNGDNYDVQTEYIFNRLNEIKPEMIEEATRNARDVAQKFATDSQSKLGKIKKAAQGQFTISSRDKNNPHIKLIRVVSTVEYYLID